MKSNHSKRLNLGVFLPAFAIIFIAAVSGLIDNEMLVRVAKRIFYFSLSDFAWLYQMVSVAALAVIVFLFFSKAGNIRLGGEQAKPAFSLPATFAMALTGGIATGLVTYSVNEPIIYLGNVYGEISQQSFAAGSREAAVFALARSFHNWSFIPYAMYSVVGLMIGYMHYNRNKDFSIAAALSPVIGRYGERPWIKSLISIVAILAITLGLASSLGAGLALISSGIQAQYGIHASPTTWLWLTLLISGVFIASTLSGLKRGMRRLASLNVYIFYALVIVLLVVGPVSYILNLSTTSLGYWLDHFFRWSFDTQESGGEALVTWWTLYDWSIWIAYAPLMGLLLARISYGRTLREFLMINWVLPSVFGVIWFGIWGGTAIKWQMDGTLDLIKSVTAQGAVAGLWSFMQNLPLAVLLVPLAIFTLILSFATSADSMTSTISSICTHGLRADEEPPKRLKAAWGLSIAVIAYVMVTFGGGEQGVDGIKYLAAAGGFVVLFVFVLIVMAAFREFVLPSVLRAAVPAPRTSAVAAFPKDVLDD